MSLPADLLTLPHPAARQVYQFIYAPAEQADPSRLEQLVPHGIDPFTRLASQALRSSLELDFPELDLSRVEHRLALLPRDGLQSLSRFVAIGSLAWPIRWTIRKPDLEQLASAISQDEWNYALTCSERQSWSDTLREGAPASADALVSQIGMLGWLEIEAASHALPEPIGRRLRLKLPPHADSTSSVQAAGQSLERVLSAYPAAIRVWAPDWDAQFADSNRARN